MTAREDTCVDSARPRSRGVLGAALLIALLLLPPATEARTQKERYPKRDTVAVDRSGIVVSIEYAIPRGREAAALRRRFDRDGSGSLEDKERSAMVRHLAREATEALSLALDGRPLDLRERTAILDATGEKDDKLLLRMELATAISISPGDHKLRVADRHPDPRVSVLVTAKLAPGLSFRERPRVVLTVAEGRPVTLALRVAEP